MKIRKRTLLTAAILFIVIGLCSVIMQGSEYTLKFRMSSPSYQADDYEVMIEQDHEVINVTDRYDEDGMLCLTLHSVSEGKASVEISDPQGNGHIETIYVHPMGVITVNTYFGDSAGDGIIPVLSFLYTALILCYVIQLYRDGMKQTMYQYRNIRSLGWVIYFASILLGHFIYLSGNSSLISSVRASLSLSSVFSSMAFPIAFIISVLVTLSNIELMRKEGKSWQNMLGVILGILVCIGTLFPHLLSEYLQRSTLVDVHNEQGAALYIEMVVTHTMLVVVTYLECILVSTIILSLKAARMIPSFDRDYILILGCQIRKDGTLTPLLKGRADRALEFAEMQKKASGYAPLFVPSGGKGDDEIISEGEAIRNYLLECGIPEDRILTEDRSVNTEENMRNSADLIREHAGRPDFKAAFSTTNYHVFRAGVLAEQQGLHAEGIGSKTKSYFWINAFVREFIAAVYSERKNHLFIIAVMILLTLAMIFTVYLSNIM